MMNWYLALYMAIIFVLSINNEVTDIYSSIQNQTIKGNLYRKYTLTNKKKLKMQYTKTQSKQTIVWLVFTIWTVCKLIRKLNLLLQLRFYGTGALYKAYQMVYGKGKWKIQDMINHFETSHRLSKPMVNHDF